MHNPYEIAGADGRSPRGPATSPNQELGQYICASLIEESAMKTRPSYTKWSRKVGGYKPCPKCSHKQVPVVKVDGRARRVQHCTRCGADLPKALSHPKRSRVKWVVREFNPSTGRTRDIACRSSEDADETIRRLERNFTPDPVQADLLEFASVLIRQIDATDRDDGINQLIQKLGGDSTVRELTPVGWPEAVDVVCGEMAEKGMSEVYVADLRRIAGDFQIITGLDEWWLVDLHAVAKYRSVRMAGDWERNGRTVKAIGGRAINRDLGTLSAFLTRAVRKGWIRENVLKNQPDEKIKVAKVRVAYMPDGDLHTLIGAASEVWMEALVVIAYYTGARRGDLLRLEWDRDVDFDGSKVVGEGLTGPHLYVRGNKCDSPHWAPLHPAAAGVLRKLRAEPVIDRKVFPIHGSTNPESRVSHLFADLCVAAGLTKVGGAEGIKNRWTLHDLRRKANSDLRNNGASPKERQALIGHRSQSVSEDHYEAVTPERSRMLIDSLPSFGMAG